MDEQLNATAFHIIRQSLPKEYHAHIRKFDAAKDAWDQITKLFIGNESIQGSKFDEVYSESEGFHMVEGEDPEEVYRRLTVLSETMTDLGCKDTNDGWVKRKFMNAIMPYEPQRAETIKSRSDFRTMSSNDVLSEFISLATMRKNSQTILERSLAGKRPNLALKAKVEVEEFEEDEDEGDVEWGNDKLKHDYNDHMALAAKTFWVSKAKNTKSRDYPRRSSSSRPSAPRPSGPRTRTCFNCGNANHFKAECPYENREDHGGRLVRKDKTKPPPNKNTGNKNFNKAPQRGLIALEQYDTGDEGEEEGERAVAAIATTTLPPNLFDAPNENLPVTNAKCFMARATEVTSTSNITPNSHISMLSDVGSLKIKQEIIGFDVFLSNLQGEGRAHFETLLSRLNEAQDLLEEKEDTIYEMEGRERDAADEIASISQALEEEQSKRVTLMESASSHEENLNLTFSSLTKERDHALAQVKVLKNEKVEFGAAHSKLCEDHENLNKAHKALESKLSMVTKSCEQLRTQLTLEEVKASQLKLLEKSGLSNPSCDHANIIEENVRLKAELAKGIASCIQGEKSLNELLSKQRDNVSKEGLGYNPKSKNKNKKKGLATTPPRVITFVKEGEQAKEKEKGKAKAKDASPSKPASPVTNNKASAPTHNNFEERYNPLYVLCRDYNGHVYAKYVGPYDGYIEWSIWVPKTLVTNLRGPIQKWVPKSKR